jgi:hypothetical protein
MELKEMLNEINRGYAGKINNIDVYINDFIPKDCIYIIGEKNKLFNFGNTFLKDLNDPEI